jgi:hypothetical protein
LETKISFYSIKKVFLKHKHLFPKGLTKIYAVKDSNEDISLQFFCDDKDVTSHFYLNQELYKFFKDAFETKKHLLEVDKQYYYVVPTHKSEKVLVDNSVVFKLRTAKNINMTDFVKYANINSSSTVYTLEKGEPIDVSISVLINYSLFFKYPIHNLLMPAYKKEMLKILLNDLLIKGYINEEKAKEIFDKETKVSN